MTEVQRRRADLVVISALRPWTCSVCGSEGDGWLIMEDSGPVAVAAAVRHEDTRYDELLMSGIDRAEARAEVRDETERVLDGCR